MDSGATSTRTPLGGSLHFDTLGLRHVKLSGTHIFWYAGQGTRACTLRVQARCGKGAHRKRRFSGDWETGA